jgi:hypothetical protein
MQVLAVACALLVPGLKAQTTIISVQPIQNSGIAASPPPSIVVSFGNPRPAADDVQNAANWSISSQGSASNRPLHVAKVFPSPQFALDGTVYLQVDQPYAFLCSETVPADGRQLTLQVVYQNAKEYVAKGPVPIICRPAFATNAVTSSTREKDSDIYINGSYTGVQDGDPQWNLDTFAGYMKEFNFGGAFGAYGQAATNSSATADLDSFLVYSVFTYAHPGRRGFTGPFQLPYLSYRVAGGEFDHKLTQLNFVTSPTIVIPFRPGPSTLKRRLPDGIEWPHMTATLGVEVVDAKESALPITHPWHTRGLLAATFSGGYVPATSRFNSISVTSNWQLRLPSAPEIFYDPKFAPRNPDGTRGNPPAMLGTQARHFVDTSMTYNLYSWIGLTFEHSFGSLPPAFNKTNHTFEIGISLTLKQSGNGRNSILRPAAGGSK